MKTWTGLAGWKTCATNVSFYSIRFAALFVCPYSPTGKWLASLSGTAHFAAAKCISHQFVTPESYIMCPPHVRCKRGHGGGLFMHWWEVYTQKRINLIEKKHAIRKVKKGLKETKGGLTGVSEAWQTCVPEQLPHRFYPQPAASKLQLCSSTDKTLCISRSVHLTFCTVLASKCRCKITDTYKYFSKRNIIILYNTVIFIGSSFLPELSICCGFIGPPSVSPSFHFGPVSICSSSTVRKVSLSFLFFYLCTAVSNPKNISKKGPARLRRFSGQCSQVDFLHLTHRPTIQKCKDVAKNAHILCQFHW